MQSIPNRYSKDPNIGSIRTILFMPMNAISSGLPLMEIAPYNHQVDVNAISIDYDKWFMAEFIQSTSRWEYAESATANGILYKHSIQFNVAKDYDFRRIDFDDMEHREYAVMLLDNNDKGVIFGHENLKGDKMGMRLSKKKNTGEKLTELNFYQLSFEMESPIMPYNAFYVTGPIVDPVPYDPNNPLPQPVNNNQQPNT